MSLFYILLRLNRFTPIIFAAIGGGVFVFHHLNIAEKLSLIFIGPIIYLSAALQSILNQYIKLNLSHEVLHYGLLLPACVIYYGAIGFLVKQLSGEKGILKFLTLTVVALFFLFIHFLAWNNLIDYLSLPPQLRTT